MPRMAKFLNICVRMGEMALPHPGGGVLLSGWAVHVVCLRASEEGAEDVGRGRRQRAWARGKRLGARFFRGWRRE